jgi:uncharacterized protein YdhG (YjbR/CyaY superfamily)
MPALKARGKLIAGFAAFERPPSYSPHSGTRIAALADAVDRFATSNRTLQFPVDEPFPRSS